MKKNVYLLTSLGDLIRPTQVSSFHNDLAWHIKENNLAEVFPVRKFKYNNDTIFADNIALSPDRSIILSNFKIQLERVMYLYDFMVHSYSFIDDILDKRLSTYFFLSQSGFPIPKWEYNFVKEPPFIIKDENSGDTEVIYNVDSSSNKYERNFISQKVVIQTKRYSFKVYLFLYNIIGALLKVTSKKMPEKLSLDDSDWFVVPLLKDNMNLNNLKTVNLSAHSLSNIFGDQCSISNNLKSSIRRVMLNENIDFTEIPKDVKDLAETVAKKLKASFIEIEIMREFGTEDLYILDIRTCSHNCELNRFYDEKYSLAEFVVNRLDENNFF